MKKLIYGSLFLAILGIIMVGCEKEDLISPATTQSVSQKTISTDGKMLVFESIEGFESAVDNLTDEKIEDLLSQTSKLQYNNYFSTAQPSLKNNSNEEMDDVLGQLLNENGVIQIGNHIFKVDLNTEQIFVISSKNKESDYEDLINSNTDNKKVSVYSIDDDVLSIVNGGTNEKCGGIGGGTYPCYPQAYHGPIVTTFANGNVWRLNPGVKFFRAGIYFRLSSLYEIWSFSNESSTTRGQKVTNLNGLFTVEMFCRYPQGWYKKRPCGSGDIGTQAGGFYYSSTLGSYQQTFYSGTRNLHGYYFYVQGRVKYPNGSVTNATYYGGNNVNSPY